MDLVKLDYVTLKYLEYQARVHIAAHDSIKTEAGAIEVYNKLAKKTFGKDHDTYQLVTHILGEEIGHEEMFENLEVKK